MPHNSARLVCFGGKCLGVGAGDLCFAFRGDPPSAEAATNAEVLENEVYYSMDLLALSAALGHGDTSGCICAWCRSDPAGFKLAAGPEKKVLDTRTLLSEMEDLEKYLAAGRPGQGAEPEAPTGSRGLWEERVCRTLLARRPAVPALGPGLVN